MKKSTIYWRDIPSQVVLQKGRTREKMQLSARFQGAIDRAAMRAGKGGSDAYLTEWRQVVEQHESIADMRAYLAQEIARLEAEFTDERLLALIRTHGVDPD